MGEGVMKVAMISCFMKTTYGAYANGLCTAIEPILGNRVLLISTNCGCGDPHAKQRVRFGLGSKHFEFPNVSFNPWRDGQSVSYKYVGRLALGKLTYWGRAEICSALTHDADVVHFQQVLGAFGSRPVFNWLKTRHNVKKIVTVHELDPYQLEFRSKNRLYNRADRVIVHFEAMKDRLVDLGVSPEKIRVVHYGTDVTDGASGERSGIVYYGGHHFDLNKGIDEVLRAFKRIVALERHARTPLTIHGHYGDEPPQQISDLVSRYGLDEHVVWLNNAYDDEVTHLYERSLFLLIPFKGSSAGGVATRAMACGLPVICTREAGLPDHLGELGIYVDVGDDAALEREMLRLLDHAEIREQMWAPLRERAERLYGWDKIAAETVEVYKEALSSRARAA